MQITRFSRPAQAAARSAAADRRVGLLHYLSMMFVVSVYAGAITPTIRLAIGGGALPPGDSDIGSTLTQTFALCVVAIWAMRNAARMIAIAKGIAPYLIIVGLCFISVAWSAFPLNSLRRSVTLTVCIYYGIYMHDQLGLEGMIRLFTRTALGLAFISVVIYFAAPTLGRDAGLGYDTALRGVFAAKNTAGMAMLLTIACILYLGSLPGANRPLAVISLLLVFGTLALTRSATSGVIALVVIGLGSRLWLRSATARFLHTAVLGGAVLIGILSLVFWPDAILLALGRDPSLTGRVPLWIESFGLIAKRPLFGYGYSGFWNVDSRDVQYLWEIIGWTAPNAHDGYIDILLQLGIVGLVLYIYMWVLIVSRAIGQVVRGTLPEATFILLFMAVNVLLNIDEGPLPYPDQFTLFSAAALLVLANARLQSSVGPTRVVGGPPLLVRPPGVRAWIRGNGLLQARDRTAAFNGLRPDTDE
jgi:O-antigen ligase